MKEVDYRDSEKFRAELHKFLGSSMIVPLAIDILHIFVFGKNLNLVFLFIELLLASIGALTVNNSYEIMRHRDIKYRKKYG